MNTKDAIKSALEHAIEDRLGFLDSIKNCGDHDLERETWERINTWRKILKRRYGDDRLPHDKALEGTVLVDPRTL